MKEIPHEPISDNTKVQLAKARFLLISSSSSRLFIVRHLFPVCSYWLSSESYTQLFWQFWQTFSRLVIRGRNRVNGAQNILSEKQNCFSVFWFFSLSVDDESAVGKTDENSWKVDLKLNVTRHWLLYVDK